MLSVERRCLWRTPGEPLKGRTGRRVNLTIDPMAVNLTARIVGNFFPASFGA
jgi:hypothetical protein